MGSKDKENDVEEVMVDEGIIIDDAELEEASVSSKSNQKIKKLREKLAQAQEEKRKFHEELQRARADFLNSKRRLDEQFVKDKERATDKLLLEFLQLADSFDTAKLDEEAWNAVDEKWRSGVDAIHSKLTSILAQHKVTSFDPIGKSFNPEQHEAVSNIQIDDDSKVDTVISVMQKGYKKGETIIRPARVIVGTK